MGTKKNHLKTMIFGLALLLLFLGSALQVQAATVGTPKIKSVKTRTAECQRVIWNQV